MTDTSVTCPNCGHPISLDETLAAPLLAETRRTFEARIATVEAAAREKEVAANRALIEAAAAKAEAEDRVRDGIAAARTEIARAEAEKAALAAAGRIAEIEARLAEAQKAQAQAIARERALADRERELDLTVQRQVSEQAAAIRQKAAADAAEAERLKLAERDKVIADMQRQIEDMKRKAEQGSQQLQGEVLELSLEATLQSRFPQDRIEPVAKGVGGADVLQHVLTHGGVACGTILWEVKRTRNWQPGWLGKLRDDQRAAGASLAVLLSDALPAGVTTFGHVDGIWVAHPGVAEPLAIVLRQSLLAVQSARIAQDGQATKTQMVYAYLTGPRFRHRVEVIIERFTEMKADLDKERRAMQRAWAKREQQIGTVIDATAGLYGDLQGIAGAAVLDLPALDLPLLPDDDGEPPAGP